MRRTLTQPATASVRREMERLFVAAWPDAATRASLGTLHRPTEPGVRWVLPEHWHVTLHFLGNCDRDQVHERLAAATLPRCRAVLGPSIEWLGPQLVIPIRGVDALAAAVRAATEGLADPARPTFRGHLTVGRVRRGTTSAVLGHPFAGAFDVDEVRLVRSEVSHTGSSYETVATFATR